MQKRCFAFLLLAVSFLLMFPLAARADVVQAPDSLSSSIEGGGIPVLAIVLVAALVVVTIVLIRILWKRK